jgi:hypothetical protein
VPVIDPRYLLAVSFISHCAAGRRRELPVVFSHERYERDDSGPFDRGRKHSLMKRTGTGNPSRSYFAAIGHEFAQFSIVFIIDMCHAIFTEFARFREPYQSFFLLWLGHD